MGRGAVNDAQGENLVAVLNGDLLGRSGVAVVQAQLAGGRIPGLLNSLRGADLGLGGVVQYGFAAVAARTG